MDKTGLKDWIISFLKNKDIVSRDIVSIKENIDGFDFVIEGSGKRFVLVVPKLSADDSLFAKVSTTSVLLVVFNSRQNLEFLIANWQKFVLNPKLCIFFVNPESSHDKKWIIYPQTHNSLIEPAALRQGLETLFSGVDEIE